MHCNILKKCAYVCIHSYCLFATYFCTYYFPYYALMPHLHVSISTFPIQQNSTLIQNLPQSESTSRHSRVTPNPNLSHSQPVFAFIFGKKKSQIPFNTFTSLILHTHLIHNHRQQNKLCIEFVLYKETDK